MSGTPTQRHGALVISNSKDKNLPTEEGIGLNVMDPAHPARCWDPVAWVDPHPEKGPRCPGCGEILMKTTRPVDDATVVQHLRACLGEGS